MISVRWFFVHAFANFFVCISALKSVYILLSDPVNASDFRVSVTLAVHCMLLPAARPSNNKKERLLHPNKCKGVRVAIKALLNSTTLALLTH